MSTIRDILMLKRVDIVSASPDTSVRDVAALMTESNVGCVIVQGRGDQVGIFTERDLLRRVVNGGLDPETTLVGQVMSLPVETCAPGDDVHDCLARLVGRNFRHLAVQEDGNIIGVISFRDLMALLHVHQLV